MEKPLRSEAVSLLNSLFGEKNRVYRNPSTAKIIDYVNRIQVDGKLPCFVHDVEGPAEFYEQWKSLCEEFQNDEPLIFNR